MNEYEKELISKNLADVLAKMESLVAEKAMLEKLFQSQVAEGRHKYDIANTRTMLIVHGREIRTAKARIGGLQNKLKKMNGI